MISMFRRFFLRSRGRSISMSSKILVLIALSVVASLSLSGWLIYGKLRDRIFSEASESLVQIASTASVGFDALTLGSLRGSSDKKSPSYRRAKDALAKIWRQNHYDLEDRWGRLGLLRLDPDRGSLTYVISLEDDTLIGKQAPPAVHIYESAVRNEAMMEDYHERRDAWLRAYAPLHGGSKDRERYFIYVESSVVRLQMELMKLMGQIILAALAGLGLALVGGWFLTQQVTKPMRAFVDGMRLMQSTGDFNLRIDLHPEDSDMSVVEETFASLIGKVREARRKEESSYWSTLQALVSALDVRDNETAGHSVRVTRYSLAIAERLRLSDAMLEQVRQGALLHDIGKIGVPDAILRKQGKLTDLEWKEMQKHPSVGRNFLQEIEFLKPANAVVYCHHERWDGGGYPNGLTGEAIPLAARIFSVADALDTITSDRYYKKAGSFREAREEIERCSGTHFDPAVVKSFLTLPEKTFLRIRLDTNMAVMQIESTRKR